MASPNPDNSYGQTIQELRDLVTGYAKQETVDPLKRLGRILAFGIPAALLAAIGTTLLLVAVLRILQTETGSTFTGDLSWLPYLITLGIAALLAVVAAMAITKRKGNKV